MSEIVIYQSPDGKSKLDVKLEDNNIWMTQEQMGVLFNRSKSTINEHISNVFEEKELEEQNVMRKFGNSEFSTKPTNFYNLEMIIAVGYRVKSKQGTQFRIWATTILKEYIEKGFAMDDERLKNNGGTDYWKELLERIRDIRSSEKVMYRQVLDLYATSRDYDPESLLSLEFFKIVQNKLHFAAHGHTAAEVIYKRIDAHKPFLGMKNFAGSLPTKKEAKIAKNYLQEDELKNLNNIVSGYFDFAEVYARRHEHLYMRDYIEHLDRILSAAGENLLQGAGKISHKKAMEKVEQQYKIYQEQTLTPVEKAYLQSIKALEQQISKKKNTTTK